MSLLGVNFHSISLTKWKLFLYLVMKENEHFPKKSKPPKLTLSGENWLAYFFSMVSRVKWKISRDWSRFTFLSYSFTSQFCALACSPRCTYFQVSFIHHSFPSGVLKNTIHVIFNIFCVATTCSSSTCWCPWPSIGQIIAGF